MDQGQLERERENATALLGSEYHDAVKGIVEDLEERHSTDLPWDTDMDGLYDSVREAVDGSEWVIYTYRSIRVLAHTNNFDAVSDAGPETVDGSLVETIQAAAFHAMVADVLESFEVSRRELERTSGRA